jgi:hypothetical protein
MNDILKRYADISALVDGLEKEQSELKDHIMGLMNEQDTALIESEYGKFKINERRQWKYGELVKASEDSLKAAKRLEEETGTAQSSTTRFLTFRA